MGKVDLIREVIHTNIYTPTFSLVRKESKTNTLQRKKQFKLNVE